MCQHLTETKIFTNAKILVFALYFWIDFFVKKISLAGDENNYREFWNFAQCLPIWNIKDFEAIRVFWDTLINSDERTNVEGL